ncbi:Uracil-DNA glycosylase [Diplonema papillatum]|nr:Uracil-DNA glycosylase [Diplonema papillatum]|eukprot:gene6351-9732_t
MPGKHALAVPDDDDETEPESEEEAPPKKKQKTQPAKPAVPPNGAAPPGAPAKKAGHDELSVLFDGCSAVWQPALRPAIEKSGRWKAFLGASRDRCIVPVRELTFQALKPVEPHEWSVVVFGQNPYPKVESATGIAMLNNAFDSWADKAFGTCSSMRCIIKAACMTKYGTPNVFPIASMRKLLHEKNVVSPREWFQAALLQGVLLLNAMLTVNGPSRGEHAAFWAPVVEQIIDTILREKVRTAGGRKPALVFAWWGAESLRTKKKLAPVLLRWRAAVDIRHVEHANPAAQGDIFCSTPTPFEALNATLKELRCPPIDWLPNKTFLQAVRAQSDAAGQRADSMADFLQNTVDLHKMYLDRLKEGLTVVDLPPIKGLRGHKLVSLEECCKALGAPQLLKAGVMAVRFVKALVRRKGKPAAAPDASPETSVDSGGEEDDAAAVLPFGLTVDEAAAVHLYTGQSLYKMLNAALRNPDRAVLDPFLPYLRLLFSAVEKQAKKPQSVFRGVALNLASSYKAGSVVTWWAVSSCTPHMKVARSFLGKAGPRTLFAIDAVSGVSIRQFSAYQAEDEYLLLPGTQLRVKSVVDKGDALYEVHLIEHPGKSLVQ